MKHGRTDSNQHEIVATLHKCGVTVAVLSDVGKGIPDLLAGYHGKNYLLECKDGSKLTPAQVKWHASWRGQKAIVNDAEDAINVVCRGV